MVPSLTPWEQVFRAAAHPSAAASLTTLTTGAMYTNGMHALAPPARVMPHRHLSKQRLSLQRSPLIHNASCSHLPNPALHRVCSKAEPAAADEMARLE